MNNRNIERLLGVVSSNLEYTTGTLSYYRIIEGITRLANMVAESRTDESTWWLGEDHLSLSDVMVGAYWFCTDYHGGMGSPEYRAMCALGESYKPNYESGPDECGESYVYQLLEIALNGGDHELAD